MRIFVNRDCCRLLCSSCSADLGIGIVALPENPIDDIRGRLEDGWMESNGDVNNITCGHCNRPQVNLKALDELEDSIDYWMNRSDNKASVETILGLMEKLVDALTPTVK